MLDERAISALRADREALVQALQDAGGTMRGTKQVFCPFHPNENTPAGAIHEHEGRWGYKCFGCEFSGDVFDVIAKVRGIPVADVLPKLTGKADPSPATAKTERQAIEDSGGEPKLELQAKYIYAHPITKAVDLIVRRYVDQNGKKSFRQSHIGLDGNEVWTAPEGLLPIYNRARVAGEEFVFIVEGEKCVHALHDVGIVATTSPGGSGAADKANWTPLAGKSVCIWPDNDAPGAKYADSVARNLAQMTPPPTLWRINPEPLGLPKKGDVVDFLASLGDIESDGKRAAVFDVAEKAEKVSGSAELHKRTRKIIEGKLRVFQLPYKRMGDYTQALMPGNVTILCGAPEAAKSFMMYQIIAYLHEIEKAPVACYELEQDKPYHERRILAQLSGNQNITNWEWVKHNPQEWDQIYGEYQQRLDSITSCIWGSPEKKLDFPVLLEWTKARLEEGRKIIIIDPITIVSKTKGKNSWDADEEFMYDAKGLIVEHNACLWLVTHPKTGASDAIGMDSLAGGAAYQRFAQTIFWLRKMEPAEVLLIRGSVGNVEREANRTLWILKASNGIGGGMVIGMNFSRDSLTFEEEGIVVKEKKARAKT